MLNASALSSGEKLRYSMSYFNKKYAQRSKAIVDSQRRTGE